MIAEIGKVEDSIREAESSWNEEQKQLSEEYLKEREPLCQRRFELVTGRSSPSESELENFTTSDPIEEEGEKEDDGKGVPFFWATVLSNQDTISEHVTRRDQLALEYVEDIRLVHNKSVVGVEFLFSKNPFFENNVMRRIVGWEEVEGGAVPIEEGTEIVWKSGQNLTVKEITKKGGKKGKESKKLKPCPSFFRFFSQAIKSRKSNFDPTAMDEDSQDDENEEIDDKVLQKVERDEVILRGLREEVIPRATHLYLSGSLKTGPSEETDEEYEVVTGASSSLHSQSLSVQKRVHVLKGIQGKLDVQRKKYIDDLHDAIGKRHEKIRKLCAERRELLVEEGNLSLPRFWLHSLRGLSLGVVAVHSRDEKALSFLADVRYDWKKTNGEDEGFKEIYEFEFLPNPYFSNSMLKREFEFQGTILKPHQARLLATDMTKVDWNESIDLTQKSTAPKKGGGPSSKPAASFFGLFKMGGAKLTFNIVGDDKDAAAEGQELELEFFQQIKDELIPNAGSLYREADVDEGEIEAEDGTESESDMSDPEELEEKRKQVRPTKTPNEGGGLLGGFKFTKANVLLGILALLVIAELLMFMDQVSYYSKFT